MKNLKSSFDWQFFQPLISRPLIVCLGLVTAVSLSGCLPQEGTAKANADAESKSKFGLKSATTVGATKVKLAWTPSEDADTFAYNIYDTTLMFEPKLLKTIPAAAKLFETTITNLTAQNLYSFRVRKVNKDGVEDTNTNDLGAIPYGGVKSNSVIDSISANLTYNDASNADAVEIYCHNALDPIDQHMLTIDDVTLTTSMITDLTGGIEYTCRVALNVSGFIDNNSITTSFTPVGTAASLVFGTQPGSSMAGLVLPAQPTVRVLDANGTLVSAGPDSTAMITLTVAAASPTTGTLRGTATVMAQGGIAIFSGLNLQEAGIKILRATKSDTSSQPKGSGPLTVNSAQFVISPDSVSPAHSAIAVSPAGPLVADGNQTYTVTVTLKDQYNNAIAGTTPQLDSSVSGDTITQPTSQTDTLGQTTGSISTTIADSARNVFVKSPSGLTTVTANAPFVAGAPSKLAFITQPANAGAGVTMASMTVAVQDVFGNTILSGAGSTEPILMAISANVGLATLSGTTTINAVNGIATFSDLNINKTGSGYKLLASSGTYAPSYSNSFNITAGTPFKISVSGANAVLSGSCSGAIYIELQDSGNNPATAIQSTPVLVSGLGLGALYTSISCSGSAQGSTVTFTAGTSKKTYYLKDNKSEGLTITATDPSAVLTTGTHGVTVSPNKIGLTVATPTVIAGQCSAQIDITPMGENGNPGPLFAPASVTLTGILGSSAVVYSDAACTQALTASNVTLPITSGVNYVTKVYVKDNKAENLSLNVSDNAATMMTVSNLQSLQVLASNLLFAGPSSVVSGICSTAFTLTLKDAAGNSVIAPANTTLTIKGLEASTTGNFYINSSCSGTAYNTSVTVPMGSSQLQLYFKDSTAETLSIYFSDPALQLANSNALAIGISPSAFEITTNPSIIDSKTTQCVGPFKLSTLDGASNITAAITPITANLTGAGASGGFYSDATCETAITSFLFAQGDQQKLFYFMGQYPEASLTFQAADQAAVLTAGTYAFVVKAAPGFIGTAVAPIMDAAGNMSSWFQTGKPTVTSRYDGAQSIRALHFNTDAANPKQYLYVADVRAGRVLKYDYLNHKYIGWIGALWGDGDNNYIAGGKPNGSTLTTPSAAECIGTGFWAQTPGWCLGGMSYQTGTNTFGSFYSVAKVTDDGNGYIYTIDHYGGNINRYNADTGAFQGWVGVVSSSPVANAAIGGLSASCPATTNGQGTPGWCYGGTNVHTWSLPTWNDGSNAALRYPMGLAYSGGYLYVSMQGAIKKFDATTGAYLGWIGMVSATPTGGAATCTSKVSGNITPGWCTGGTYQTQNMRYSPGAINHPYDIEVIGTTLYVLSGDSGSVVSKYDVATGAFIGKLSNLMYDWTGARDLTTDGTHLYIADYNRTIRVDPSNGVVTGWIGKVKSTPTSDVSGAIVGCATLAVNANTPGWCLGGEANYGVDENAFLGSMAIALDDAGNIITGGRDWWNGAHLQKFDSVTGAYEGTLAYESASPSQWSDNTTTKAQLEGFDDKSMNRPGGIYSDGTHLYVAESHASRVKKIHIKTGATVGWVGAVGTAPTGGSPACIGQLGMSSALGWCLGALYVPENRAGSLMANNVDGTMHQPVAVTGDGTYLYVVDMLWHRIQKFKLSDGSYQGWVGRVSSTAGLSSGLGCSATSSGNATPAWCKGGIAQAGTGDGHLYYPSGITYAAGTLYVVDGHNQRISSYDAATGAFKGWIGRVNAAPSSGCTTTTNANGYTISGSGWCFGGTAQEARSDKGGGFNFEYDDRPSISTNGASLLYISNYHNTRIDKYNLNGEFQEAVSTDHTAFNKVWSNNSTSVGNMYVGRSYPTGIYVDSTHMYVLLNASWYNSSTILTKMDIVTGNVIGWKGYVLPDYPAANNGEAGKSGCAGLRNAMTPEWCQGGVQGYSLYLGGFWNARGITGDAHYLYITDRDTHRITRIPK